MPNTTSAERRMRNSQRKHLHNLSVKSRLRRLEKNYRALLASGKKDEAVKLLPGVNSAYRQGRQVRCGAPVRRQPQEIPFVRRAQPRRVNRFDFHNPIFASRKASAVPRHPKPYFKLRRKLMEDASGKYFVGQLTSPIVNPCQRICASIWLSKTKSSEFPASGERLQDFP